MIMSNNPDPALFKFFCPAQKCWCMDESVCERRIALIQGRYANPQKKGPTPALPRVRAHEFFPNIEHCRECERGKEIMERERGREKKKRGRPPKKQKWPVLENVAEDYTDRIFQLKAAIEQAAGDADLPVEEIIFLGLEAGLEFYLKKTTP